MRLLRSLALALAAVVAMSGVATSAENSKLTLTDTTMIRVGMAICSITLVDATTALTASHCDPKGFKVGDVVHMDRTPIGTIGALGNQADPSYYVDVVRIDLDPNTVTVDHPVEIGRSADLRPGDTVRRVGAVSQREGRIVSDGAQTGHWHYGPEKYMLSTANGRHGDSGGAVFDAQGRLVGVHSAVLSGKQMFVPIDFAAKLLQR